MVKHIGFNKKQVEVKLSHRVRQVILKNTYGFFLLKRTFVQYYFPSCPQ